MNNVETFPTFIRLGRGLRRGAGAMMVFVRWVWRKKWMPAIWLWRKKRAIVFGTASLATLLALAVAEENYRTGKAWEQYQEGARARGEKLTLPELASPPVPDDQNFAMTPLLKPLFSDPDYGRSLEKRLTIPVPVSYGSFGEWRSGKKLDLGQLAKSFGQDDLLEALKKFDAEMAEISTASRRLYSRFPIPYEKGEIWIPQSTPLRILARLFELRAIAELDKGQSDRALEDAVTMFRLAGAMKDEPFVLSAMVSCSQYNWDLQVVWEGLAANRWSEAQITALQQEMQKVDLFPQFAKSFTGERAGLVKFAEGEKALGFFRQLKFIKDPYIPVMPAFGWNKAEMEGLDYYRQYVVPMVDVAGRRISPAASRAAMDFLDKKYQQNRWLHPEVFYLELLSPFNGLARIYAMTQSGLDEAILACALERFKMEHGDYPAQLNELVPQYMAKLPHDVITGEPLHYQRTVDGRFMLYSVGWDATDNQGRPGDDWVWQYTPAQK